MNTDQPLRERAAEIILSYAGQIYHGCNGDAPFSCEDCPAEGGREQCRAEHAEMVEVAVKLRGAQ